MSKIGIINCGMGNLTSVKNAFLSIGADCSFIQSAQEVEDYDKIVLPGVGAFASMMQKLEDGNFKKSILKHISDDKPFMGICLGMQVLFDRSNEFGNTTGLCVLSGEVIRLPIGDQPVPNVGWWDLSGNFSAFSEALSDQDAFYFVHSYVCSSNESYERLNIEINGSEVMVAVRRDNLFGYQFHPEKSQKSGRKLLKSFVNL